MTVDDISALIALGESRTLELKKNTGELKDECTRRALFSIAEQCDVKDLK